MWLLEALWLCVCGLVVVRGACNRSAQLSCVVSCHTVVCGRMSTVGCIIVGQGIVCLIH